MKLFLRRFQHLQGSSLSLLAPNVNEIYYPHKKEASRGLDSRIYDFVAHVKTGRQTIFLRTVPGVRDSDDGDDAGSLFVGGVPGCLSPLPVAEDRNVSFVTLGQWAELFEGEPRRRLFVPPRDGDSETWASGFFIAD